MSAPRVQNWRPHSRAHIFPHSDLSSSSNLNGSSSELFSAASKAGFGTPPCSSSESDDEEDEELEESVESEPDEPSATPSGIEDLSIQHWRYETICSTHKQTRDTSSKLDSP